MKARLVQIGNSRGVRLPKLLIEQAGLSQEVELDVRKGAILISSPRRPRAGWAEAAQLAHVRGDDQLLDPPAATRFDNEEWEW